jgi:hypothetical protein
MHLGAWLYLAMLGLLGLLGGFLYIARRSVWYNNPA